MERVVYRARPGRNLSHVVHLLRTNGLTPMVLDQTAPDGTLEYASGWSYRVRVAVPEEQVPKALGLLAEWDRETSQALAGHLKPLRRQVLTAMLMGAPIGAVFWAIVLAEGGDAPFVDVVRMFGAAFVLVFLLLSFRKRPGGPRKEDED